MARKVRISVAEAQHVDRLIRQQESAQTELVAAMQALSTAHGIRPEQFESIDTIARVIILRPSPPGWARRLLRRLAQ